MAVKLTAFMGLLLQWHGAPLDCALRRLSLGMEGMCSCECTEYTVAVS